VFINGVDYDFFEVDLGYIANLPFGERQYHLVVQTTSSDFEDRNEVGRNTAVHGLSLSMNQTLGDGFAVFVRAGGSNKDAA
jgi:hypothetical protein